MTAPASGAAEDANEAALRLIRYDWWTLACVLLVLLRSVYDCGQRVNLGKIIPDGGFLRAGLLSSRENNP